MDGLSARRRILLSAPHLESDSGELLTFNTDMKSPLKQCKVEFPPTQEGSGEPSYDNVRPITGWTGVNLRKANENLWDDEWYSYGNVMQPVTDPSDDFFGYWSGAVKSWDNALRPITFNLFPRGVDKLTVTADYGAKGGVFTFRVYFRYIDGAEGYNGGNISIGANAKATVTRTSNSNYNKCTGFVISTSAGITNYRGRVKNVRVTVNDSTEYVIPVTTLIPISWADSAGTVYGGYVDLVKGELIVEWVKFVFDRNSRVSNSGISADEIFTWMTLRITHRTPPFQTTPNNGDDYGVFSLGNWRYSAQVGKNRAYVNSAYVYAVLLSDTEDLTTVEGRTAYFDRLEANNIPIEVAYKIATPMHYQLTPQQINTIKGTNNLWSNTDGTIDVKYWTH